MIGASLFSIGTLLLLTGVGIYIRTRACDTAERMQDRIYGTPSTSCRCTTAPQRRYRFDDPTYVRLVLDADRRIVKIHERAGSDL